MLPVVQQSRKKAFARRSTRKPLQRFLSHSARGATAIFHNGKCSRYLVSGNSTQALEPTRAGLSSVVAQRIVRIGSHRTDRRVQTAQVSRCFRRFECGGLWCPTKATSSSVLR